MSATAMYISTRGGIEPVGFRDAVLMGLADDGGLLLPAALPTVTDGLSGWRKLAYPQLAAAVMQPFVGTELPPSQLLALTQRSYAGFDDPDVVPVRAVGPIQVMELFHGPTLAFKDIALQFLGNLFARLLADSGRALNILGATSGDTGSAAIAGVRGKGNIHIFVMYPHGRVSPLQERQMTTVADPNVHCLAIEGTFDDGQRVLKQIFTDIGFKSEFCLGAVNSVNWARVLAQIVYYFHAAFRVAEQTGVASVQVCVPTGNFGDIFAGYLARAMGAPISRLILATNENDILARFFNTGVYARGRVTPTTSPSMDIQVASNFERYLYYRTGADPEAVRSLMAGFERHGRLQIEGMDTAFVAGTGTTAASMATIRRYYEDFGYLLDPHTAVGVTVAERYLSKSEPTVCLATAHAAKFPQTIAQALGRDVARHPALERLLELPTRRTVLPAEKAAIQEYIARALGS